MQQLDELLAQLAAQNTQERPVRVAETATPQAEEAVSRTNLQLAGLTIATGDAPATQTVVH